MTAKYDQRQMKKRLKGVIDERELSMRAVSLGSGVSESYIAGILATDRDPHLGKLINICEFLGVSSSWLLYGFDVPDGADEILQLISKHPEMSSTVAALLRSQRDAAL